MALGFAVSGLFRSPLSSARAKGKIDLFPLLATSLRLFGGKKLRKRARERPLGKEQSRVKLQERLRKEGRARSKKLCEIYRNCWKSIAKESEQAIVN